MPLVLSILVYLLLLWRASVLHRDNLVRAFLLKLAIALIALTQLLVVLSSTYHKKQELVSEQEVYELSAPPYVRVTHIIPGSFLSLRCSSLLPDHVAKVACETEQQHYITRFGISKQKIY